MNKKLLSLLATLITTVASAYTPISKIDALVFLPEKALSRNFCELNPKNADCGMFREYLRIINECAYLSQLDEKADQYLINAYNASPSIQPNKESAQKINTYLTNKATIQALLNNKAFIDSINLGVKNLIRQAIEPKTEEAFGQEADLLLLAVKNASENASQGELSYKSAQ